MIYLKFGFINFNEKFEVAEGTRWLAKSLFYHPLSTPLYHKLQFKFLGANTCSPKDVTNQPKGVPFSNLSNRIDHFKANPFGHPNLTWQSYSVTPHSDRRVCLQLFFCDYASNASKFSLIVLLTYQDLRLLVETWHTERRPTGLGPIRMHMHPEAKWPNFPHLVEMDKEKGSTCVTWDQLR